MYIQKGGAKRSVVNEVGKDALIGKRHASTIGNSAYRRISRIVGQ
jgi:hypothetical protein